MSTQSSRDAASRAVTTTKSSFCQAIFFFHVCGCRTPEPFFVCQPPSHSQIDTQNPCRHEEPALIVAKHPHPCKRCLGNSKARGTEDLSTKQFVREVDTAEQLELVVSKRLNQDNIQDCLPQKIKGNFTVDKVVSKSLRDGKCRSTLSATAAPFVPRLEACGTATGNAAAAAGTNRAETPHENQEEAGEDISLDGIQVSIDDEFSDVDLSDTAFEDTVSKDELDSSISTSDRETKNEELDSSVEDADPYDMVAFQAMEGNGKADPKHDRKPTRTCVGMTIAIIFKLLGRD
ncbi:hypothetical protein F5Y01DRAFT_320119 [Xylaria sp. FL0043]|nr:hypothetical protein F5Y01DRAFT_320119 [Xylaria sp. FL0043]